MSGLPRSIIKKYGVSKKAWSVFRSMRSGSSSSSRSTTNKKQVKHMARRKSYSKRAKAHFRKHKGIYGLLGTLAAAAAYGAVRSKVSAYLDPYTSKIPLGAISDEVGMIAVCMLVNKFAGNKVPMLRSVCKAGMIIEAAQIGQAVASGQVNLGSLGSTSGSSNIVG